MEVRKKYCNVIEGLKKKFDPVEEGGSMNITSMESKETAHF
jgi:hypothetical protein